MKRIIHGALYNTETAKLIASWEPNGYDQSNFEYFCETLYCTKSGKYFIHGAGHARTCYGEWRGNNGSWGEQIRPYSPAEADEWAKEHLTTEHYSAVFGAPGGRRPRPAEFKRPRRHQSKIGSAEKRNRKIN